MANIDWNLPTVDSLYSDVLPEIHEKAVSSATMFNNVSGTDINIPTGAVKLGVSGANFVFQRYLSSTWTTIATTFDMSVTELNDQVGSYYLDYANFTGSIPVTAFSSTAHGELVSVFGDGSPLHSLATTSAHGMMSSTDKTNLDALTAQTIDGPYVESAYNGQVSFATDGELIAGTETETRRLAPLSLFTAITAKLKKAVSIVFNEMYDVGSITGTPAALDVYNGQYQTMILTGNTTLSFVPYSDNPYTFYLHIKQDATGSRTLTLPTGMWENGVARDINTTPNALNLLTVHWTGSTYIYMLLADVK